jgi:hypothetical protein
MIWRKSSAAGVEETYKSLRSMALAAVANGLRSPSADHPDVSGLVVDIPSLGGCATLVVLTDDTTSMYMSTGGGTIGAGTHAAVASMAQELLGTVQMNLGSFTKAEDASLPESGTVRLHALGPSRSVSEDVAEDCFWGRAPHELTPVIEATHAVIAAIRGIPD